VKGSYKLSTEAQNSLRDIKVYSDKIFGKKRTKAYLKSIQKRMQALADYPLLGIVREELKVGYHSDFIGSHTIYYQIEPLHIGIINVLHQSIDPSKYISN